MARLKNRIGSASGLLLSACMFSIPLIPCLLLCDTLFSILQWGYRITVCYEGQLCMADTNRPLSMKGSQVYAALCQLGTLRHRLCCTLNITPSSTSTVPIRLPSISPQKYPQRIDSLDPR